MMPAVLLWHSILLKNNHRGDSDDATCAVVRVICILLHAKTFLSEYIDILFVSCFGQQRNYKYRIYVAHHIIGYDHILGRQQGLHVMLYK